MKVKIGGFNFCGTKSIHENSENQFPSKISRYTVISTHSSKAQPSC